MPTARPLALALALAPVLAAQDADVLRRELAEIPERPVREAAENCRNRNDVESVELLLEVLRQTERRTSRHLAPAHYRDIAWEALTGITDFYARQRVEVEMKQSRDPWVRQWCAELLGIYRDASFGGTLMRGLKDPDPGVRRWSARGLGAMKMVEALGALERPARDRDPYVRANAIEARARIDAAAHGDEMVDAIRNDKDAGVRCALLGALPEALPDHVEELSVHALEDDDWRPRMQAVDNLTRVRTRTAVDALIAALDDARPVVGLRALESLQQLTGKPIRLAAQWKSWWAAERDTFEFPEGSGDKVGRDEGRTVTYNGIPLVSDHVAFLLDKSFAMRQSLKSKPGTKDEAAQAELARVLDALEGELVFNVHAYDEEVRTFAKKPVDLSKRAQAKAIQFATEQPKGRAKDIWQVLELVVSDETIDTVYLLSSGEPDVGLYVHWNRVTRHLADLNRFHKVVVHSIAYSDNDWYREQLQKISEVTGGDFEAIE